MQVDLQRLEAMRRAWSLAKATSIGLSHQAIAAEQDRNRAVGHLAGLRQRAEAYPEAPRRQDETDEDINERRNAAASALAERKRQLRGALRDHPAQLGQALAELDQARAEDFEQGLAEAAAAVERVEREIAELRAEQGRWGNRAGALGQSIDQAERWLAEHPEALREVVMDEEEQAA